jgi:enolase
MSCSSFKAAGIKLYNQKRRKMKIKTIIARPIFDSCGTPTIECVLVLEDGAAFIASVPVGTSRSIYEACELRDGGVSVKGQGVWSSVEKIEKVIAPLLIGQEPNVVAMDAELIALDGTPDKSSLGANTMLAVSMVVCRAQAYLEELRLYEFIAYLAGFETISLMSPLFNVINGGVHAHNKLVFQEFMVLPVGIGSLRMAIEFGIQVQHEIGRLLTKKNMFFGRGIEGGISADFEQETQALDILLEASEKIARDMGATPMLAIDAAASQWYDAKTLLYKVRSKTVDCSELIQWYEKLSRDYPLYALEDGVAASDVEGWHQLVEALGSKIHVVGDDLFATHTERICAAFDDKLLVDVLIKPNQAGTITETLQAAMLCSEYERPIFVSHRSGETNDSFIVDLAVGLNAHHLKAGGLTGGEHMAKYNRLLAIEDELLTNNQSI